MAALYSSRRTGKKKFNLVIFILGGRLLLVYMIEKSHGQREGRRGECLTYCPAMCIVIRGQDSTSRRQKIIQNHEIAELKEYIHTESPHVLSSQDLTVQYLQACNKMFENGLLSYTPIRSTDSTVLHNIDEGFHFFYGLV